MTGNWLSHSIGANSSGNDELSESGTFNKANEWTGRARTVPGSATDTLSYDAVGNLTDNGKGEKYVYDGFGRLREVRLTGESDRIKAAYRYNGLGMRISHAINTSSGSSDNDVSDATDPVTWFGYDERWRLVAAYSETAYAVPTTTPTERYVYHAAGIAGHGGSSYIDSLIHRDRDLNPSDGTLYEERNYILQNWRADVVATTNSTGTLIERIAYTAYGSATTYLYNGTVRGDFNGDGGVDGDDVSAYMAAWSIGDPSADADLNGGVDGDDIDAWYILWNAGTLSQDYFDTQPGACQTTSVKFGYAGYVRDGSVNNSREYTDASSGLHHVRHRVYDPELGRWTRRDPIGYVDGMGLYEYVGSGAVAYIDSTGLSRVRLGSALPDWLTAMLLLHYRIGRGENLNLTAEFDNFSTSYFKDAGVNSSIMSIHDEVRSQAIRTGIIETMRLNCCTPLGPERIDHVLNTKFATSVNSGIGSMLDGIWVMGGHFLHTIAKCDITAKCNNGPIHGWYDIIYSCNLTITATDRFERPFDLPIPVRQFPVIIPISLPGYPPPIFTIPLPRRTNIDYEVGRAFNYSFAFGDTVQGKMRYGWWPASRCIRSQ